MIKITNLNKYYSKGKDNELHVINNVSLELPDNGLVAFLGQSGCGKTTLLNVIGGLDKSNSGEISYDDFTSTKYDSAKIDKFRNEYISYIFQNYLLLEDLTVYDNLKLALEIIGVLDKDEVDKRITYTLKSVGMYKYRKKLASALSGGQQQRVAIARALLKNAKIILADEPTGNLDKKNSIEVMNILKKISENTLVLLVTHSKELAEFYSDKIILLSDGKIVKEKKGELESLDNNLDDTIYLKDLKEENNTIGDISVKLYRDDDSKIDLRIIKKNGKLYIDSPLEIKLIDNKIKVLDEKYDDLKKSEITNYSFDTSWYSNNSKKEKESFWSIFKYSIVNLFKGKRKSKFFNLLFVCIGILLAITSIVYGNAMENNYSINYIEDKYMVYDADKENQKLNEKLLDAYDRGYISEISNFNLGQIQMIYSETYLSDKNYYTSIDLMPSNFIKASEMLVGNYPTNEEVVITKGTADEMLKTFKLDSYENLLNRQVLLGSMYDDKPRSMYRIAGITKNSGYAMYAAPNSGQFINSPEANKYAFNYFADIEYDLVEGLPIKNSNQVLAFADSGLKLNDTIRLDIRGNSNDKVIDYIVVGLVNPKDYKDIQKGLIFDSKETLKNIYVKEEETYLPNNFASYKIIEGRDVNNSLECVVSELCDYNIGDKVGKYIIVGKYEADARTFGYANIISAKDYNLQIINNSFNYAYSYFKVNNKEALTNLLDNYKFDTIYNVREKMYRNDQMETLTIYIAVSVVLLVVSSLYIYFIMRSKLISSIYPTAVIRNIGASKKFIYRRFLIELLAITIFTNLLGYLGTYLFYYLFLYTLEGIFTISIFAINLSIFLLGILLIFVLNFCIGILPIHRYLKDTPAEAQSKYDI